MYLHVSEAEHKLRQWQDLGHHPSKDELCKIQHCLSSVDEKYSEGAFHVNGATPEGQAILANLLESAHRRLREFEVEIDD